MKKEDYVSLECAKLLKEKGYNEPVLSQYSKQGSVWNCYEPENFNESEGCSSRPTLYEAQKWLREKHNLFIEITYMHGNYYIYSILTIPTHDYIGLDCVRINSDNYEQCLNAGIIEALKLI